MKFQADLGGRSGSEGVNQGRKGARPRLWRKRESRLHFLEKLEPRLVLASQWTNPHVPLDVSGDGKVTPLDAAVLVNKINASGFGPLSQLAEPGSPPPFYDVTGEGELSPQDLLTVINAINTDQTGPAISLGLANDAGFSDDDRLTFDPRLTGTALDEFLGISSVRGRVDGGAFLNVPVAADGSFAYTPTLPTNGTADGMHTVEIEARDGFGNRSTATFEFQLDTVRPAAPFNLQLPAASDSGASASDGITNVTSPRITGVYNGGEQVVVRLQSGGEVLAEQPTSGAWQIDLLALQDGTYNVTAVTMDAAGNLSAPSPAKTLVIDTQPPAPPNVAGLTAASDSGASSTDGITQVTTPTVVADAESGSTVRLFVDGSAAGTATANSPVQFTLSALADGDFSITATATDRAGNVSDLSAEFPLVIDNTAPTLITGLTGTLRQTFDVLPLVFGDRMAGAAFNSASYRLAVLGGANSGQPIGIESVAQLDLGTPALNLDRTLPDQGYRFTIQQPLVDLAGNAYGGPTMFDFTMADPPNVERFSPSGGEQLVRLNRELIVELDEPINAASVNADNFYALASGERLPGTVRVATDGKKITLFTTNDLPPSSTVRLMIDGGQIVGADGLPLDADGDTEPGGMAAVDFATVASTSIAGTGVFGYVMDSHRRNPDGSNVPIVGATLTVEGRPDLTVTTDATGRFEIDNSPFPEFFVDINGNTASNAPEGFIYGRVTKPFHPVAGQVMQINMAGMPFNIYLPLMAFSDAIPVVPGQMTMAGFNAAAMAQVAEITPELDPSVWEMLTIEIPPDSLFFDDGTPASVVSVFPLDPKRIPVPLPPGADPAIVFSVDAGGAENFDVPAKITYPNLDGLAPGEQRFIYSFDHDAGEWRPTGTMTVSPDGSMLVSDNGVQTLGWRYVGPDPDNCGKGSPPDKPPKKNNQPTVHDPQTLFITGESGTFSFKTFKAPDKVDDTPPPPPPKGCPAPPKEKKVQPERRVKIEVDGKLEKFAKKTGNVELKTQGEIILKAGSGKEVKLSGKAKTYSEFFGAGGFAALKRDQLHGAKIQVTETFKDEHGNTTTDIYTYVIARWVDVVDAAEADMRRGNTAVFFPAHTDDVERLKKIDLFLPSSVKNSFTGSGNGFTFSNGSGNSATWKFDPDSAGIKTQTATIQWDFKVRDRSFTKMMGDLTARGKAIAPTTIGINLAGYRAELQNVLNSLGARPGPDGQAGRRGVDDDQNGLTDDVTEYGWPGTDDIVEYIQGGAVHTVASNNFKSVFHTVYHWVNPSAATLDNVLTAQSNALLAAVQRDFNQLPGITINGTAAGSVSLTWRELGTGLFGSADGDPTPGEQTNATVMKLLSPSNSNIGSAAKQLYLAEFINRRHSMENGRFAVGININWVSSATFAQFVANTVSHEISHTFGTLDSYDNNRPSMRYQPFDIMMNGIETDPNLTFAHVNRVLLQTSMGAQNNGDTPIGNVLKLFQDNYYLPNTPPNLMRDQASGTLPNFVLTLDEIERFDGDVIDVGPLPVDPNAAQHLLTFTIRNVDSSPLQLNEIELTHGDRGFSLAGAPANGTTVDAFASVSFEVMVTPGAVGELVDELVIHSNASAAPVFTLDVKALGVVNNAVAEVVVSENNLGGVPWDGGQALLPELATITNRGGVPLVISDIRLADGVGPFSLIDVPEDLGANPMQLAFGETFTFGIAFDPSRGGLDRALIEIVTNDPARPTQRISAVGTGLEEIVFPAWGEDFFAFEKIDSGLPVLQRVRSDMAGSFQIITPANTNYHLVGFDPVTGLVAHGYGRTPAPGIGIDLTVDLVFDGSLERDGDFDGLPDDVEFAVGTAANMRDTDSDGIDDFAEIAGGLDPLEGRAIPTGIVGAVALRGTAEEVVVEGSVLEAERQTAYVATGAYGLAIVDTTQFNNPIVLGQLDLTGTNTDVAIDHARQIAAVAAGATGFHLVDVSDPVMPRLIRTVTIAGAVERLEILDGVVYTAGSKLNAIDVLTGERIETLNLDAAVRDLAIEGRTLYAITADNRLHVIDLHEAEAVIRGSAAASHAAQRVFVGNGVAYVADGREAIFVTGPNAEAPSGHSTIDVSDPDAPVLLSGIDTPQVQSGNFKTVLNGSGLGLIAAGTRGLEVHDETNPTVTYSFLNRFDTPGTARSVTVAGGLAFVPDGSAGLQVINYLPFDVTGQPPTVAITAPGADMAAGVAGIQVVEGSSFSIVAAVTDDVQVRNVELLVDGQVVRNDVSFPFDVAVIAPKLSQANQIRVQVRATDTGGNTTLSAPLRIDVVPDTFPPEIQMITPRDGAIRGNVFRTVRIGFSEPMKTDTLDGTTIQLRSVSSPGNPLVPVDLQYRNDDRVVQLTYATLTPGDYTLTLKRNSIADRPGNFMSGGDLVTTFTVLETTAVFINGDGGAWDDVNNWEGQRLPGPGDNVFISLPPGATVEHRQGTTQINSLTSFNDVRLTGGTLDIASVAQIEADFSLSGGTLVNATLPASPSIPAVEVASFATVTLDNVKVQGNLLARPNSMVTIQNGLRLDGRLTLTGSTIGVTGTQTWSGGGTLQIGQPNLFSNSTVQVPSFQSLTLDASLTVEAHGSGTIGSSGVVNLLGRFVNRGSSTMTLTGLSNQGRIEAERGLVIVTNSANVAGGVLTGGVWAARNTGILRFDQEIISNAAEVTLDGAAAQWQNPAGGNAAATLEMNTAAGRLILKNGNQQTTGGAFRNDGRLEVGAGSKLSVGGNFSHAAGATLAMELAHAGQSGRVAATGPATLDGALTLTVPAGLNPELGSFRLLEFSGRTGGFSAVTGLPVGLPRLLQFSSGDATLHVGSTFAGALPLPLAEAFATSPLGGGWISRPGAFGTIEVSTTGGPRTEPLHLLLTGNGNVNQIAANEAILLLNTAGQSQLELNFYHKAQGESGETLPASFVGSVAGDGVSISLDGITWRRVVDLAAATGGGYGQFVVDLDAALAAAGLSLSDHLAIKFQQSHTSGAASPALRMFDDVRVGGDAVGPRLTSVTPAGPLVFSTGLTQFNAVFDTPLSAASAGNATNYSLVGAGSDGVFGTSDDQTIQLAANFDGDRMVSLNVVGSTPPGAPPLANQLYRLTFRGGSTIADAAGNPLNDGLDDVRVFELSSIESPTNGTTGTATDTGLTATGGSFSTAAAIGNDGGNLAELDLYRLTAGAGQFLRITATPRPRADGSPTADLQIRLLDANGQPLSEANPANASGATLPFGLIDAGTYFVEVRGVNQTAAIYDLDINLVSNAASFPLVEDFEAGPPLAMFWETHSTGTGRIRVTGDLGPIGDFQLVADADVPLAPWLLVYQDGTFPPHALTSLGLLNGVDFVVTTPSQFAALSPAQIAAFEAIYVPTFVDDFSGITHDEDGDGTSDLAVALAGVGTTGRAVLSGLHADASIGGAGQQFIANALTWIRAGQTTGLLALVDFNFSGAYDWTPWAGDIPAVIQSGGSTVQIVAAGHPVVAGLTAADLGNQTHFDLAFPQGAIGFTPLITRGFAPNHPIVLARGMGSDVLPLGAHPPSLNEAILHANLAGQDNVELQFSAKTFGENSDDEFVACPAMFSGSVECTGVSLSVDAVNWHSLFEPNGFAPFFSHYHQEEFDLDEFAAARGLVLGPLTQIKFQNMVRGPAPFAGIAFDNIRLVEDRTGPTVFFNPPVRPTVPHDVAVGDVNGDGYDDVVTANTVLLGDTQRNSISLLTGRADGTLDPQIERDVPEFVRRVQLVHANAGGDLDLLLLHGEAISLSLGNGDGTFQPAIVTPMPDGVTEAAAGDVDGDGNLDLVVLNHQFRGSFTVLLGDGAGGFTALPPVELGGGFGEAEASGGVGGQGAEGEIGAGGPSLSIALANVVGSAALDVLVGLEFPGSVTIFTGDGTGGFDSPLDLPLGTNDVQFIGTGDFNEDGRRDVVAVGEVLNRFREMATLVALADGNGGFTVGQPVASNFFFENRMTAAVGDFDGDQNLDVLLPSFDSQPGDDFVTLLRGNGSGGLVASQVFVDGNPVAVAAGDVNGDGRADVVSVNEFSFAVGSFGNGSASVALGQAGGTFGPHQDFSIGSRRIVQGSLDLSELTATFFETGLVDPATLTDPANYEFRMAGPDGIFDNGDDVLVPIDPDQSSDTLRPNDVVLHLDPALANWAVGRVRISIDGTSSIRDAEGNPLNDFDGDGGGSDFTFEFESIDNGPVVTQQTPAANADILPGLSQITLTFSEPLATGSFTLDDITEFIGPGGPITPTAVNVVGTTATITFPAQTTLGFYSFDVGPEIRDLLGQPMNQDFDFAYGEANDDLFLGDFEISQRNRWIDPAGGSWHDAANWSTGVVPTAAHDVSLLVGGDYTITVAAPIEFNTLTLNNLSQPTPTLAFVEDATLDGTTTVFGNAAIDIAAGKTLTVNSVLNVSGGVVGGEGTLHVAAAGDLNLNIGGILRDATVTAAGGADLIANGGTLDGLTLNAPLTVSSARTLSVTNGLILNGSIVLNANSFSTSTTLQFLEAQTLGGSGTVTLGGNPGRISRVTPGNGTLTIGDDVTIRVTADGTIGGTAVGMINQGTIVADGVNGIATLRGNVFVNEGTLRTANSGTMVLENTWDNNGLLDVPSGVMAFGGTFTADAIGTMNRTGGKVEIRGTLENTGRTLTLDASTGSWELNGVLQFDNTVVGGTIRGGSIVTNNGVDLRVESSRDGRLDGVTVPAGSLVLVRNAGDLLVTGGLTLDGTLRIENTGSTTDAIFTGSQTITGGGQVILAGTSGGDASRIDVPTGSSLTIGADVTVTAEGNGQVGTVGGLTSNGELRVATSGKRITIGGASFTNHGMISATNGSTVTISATNWQNDGAIVANGSTLNLGGRFVLDAANSIQLTASTVNITGTLDNRNDTLLLDGTTGSWNLSGGTILGGVIDSAGGQSLVVTANSNNKLDGVTLEGDLTVGVSARTKVANGLTVNGRVLMTGNSGSLAFEGTQTLGGTGEVFFDPATANHYLEMAATGTLTIGPDMTLRGGNGSLGGPWWFSADMAIVNRGTILANGTTSQPVKLFGRNGTVRNEGTLRAAGGAIELDSFTVNTGLIEATGGGTVDLDGNWDNDGTIRAIDSTLTLRGQFTTDKLGTLDTDGAIVNVAGKWDNTGRTVTLDADTSWRINVGGEIKGGTIDPGSLATLATAGRLGGGLELEGLKNTVMLPIEVLDGQTDATIEFWYRTTKTGNQAILQGSRTGDLATLDVRFDSATQARFGSDTWIIGSIADGQWRHFAFVRNDVANQVSFYVDGVLQSTKSRSFSAIDLDREGLVIGQQPGAIGGSFTVANAADGTLDELRIWSVARGGAAIAADRETVLAGNEAGLRGYWRFEENAGMTSADSAGDFDGRLSTRLIVTDTNANNRLDGVTINSDFDVEGNRVRVNNLTLNGTAYFGFGSFGFEGNQTLAGSGTIAFGSNSLGYLETVTAGTLTVGPGVTIRGGYGKLGGPNWWNAAMNVVNQGTLDADLPGRYIRVWGNNGTVTNAGTFAASAGTLDVRNLSGSVAGGSASAGGILDFTGTYDITGDYTIDDATMTLRGTSTIRGMITVTNAPNSLNLEGDWENNGTIVLSDSTANLDGTFTAADLGDFQTTRSTVNIKGTFDNTGHTIVTEADDTWRLDDGEIRGGNIAAGGVAEMSVPGRIGNAVDFRGNYSAVQLPGAAIQGLTDSTFVFWYKTDSTGYQTMLNGKHPNGSADNTSIYLETPTRVRFDNATWDVPASLADDQWHHYAFLRNDTTNQVTLYLDGVSRGVKSQSLAAIDVHARGLVLGQYANGLLADYTPTYSDRGTLDELNIWSRLLSEAEIVAGMNSPLVGNEAGLRGYWSFDEASGNSWSDATSNARSARPDIRLHVTGDYDNLLDGVTVDGALDFTFTGSARTRVKNGLTVNGTLYMHSNSALGFDGSQTIGGSGTVHFSTGSGQFVMAAAGTLTVGPQLTLLGGVAQFGGTYGPWNFNMDIVNQGTIHADLSGRTLQVVGRNGTVSSPGRFMASNGGTLNADNLTGNVGLGTATTGGVLDFDGTYTLAQNQTIDAGTLKLLGTWSNTAAIDLDHNATATLDGTFTTASLGAIHARASKVSIEGTLNNAGATLTPTADGTWQLSDGTILGGTIGIADVTTASVAGQLGNAVEFLGNDTAVLLPGAAVDGLTDATFEFWYKTASSEFQTILYGKHPNGIAENLRVYLTTSTQMQIDGVTWTLPANVADDQWHHYAIVRDDTGNMISLYFDAALVSTKPVSMTAIDVHERGVTLGQYAGVLQAEYNPNNSGPGVLDELRIWNTRRTAQEISDHRNQTLTGGESGLHGYWRFDETAGSTFNDLSPNALHGRIDARLHVLADSDNLLDGVTVNGSLDLSFNGSARTRVANGLTVNGTVYQGNNTSLGFIGSQTIGGSGRIQFGVNRGYLEMVTAGTLTLGPQLTLLGGEGKLGGPWHWSADSNMSIVNQGKIHADVGTRTIQVTGRNGTVDSSAGQLLASGDGRLDVENLTGNVGNGTATAQGKLFLDGTYTIVGTQTVTADSELTLFGDWTNAGTIAADDSRVMFAGTFTTADIGNLDFHNSAASIMGQWNNTGATHALHAGAEFVLNGGSITGGTLTDGTLDPLSTAGQLGNGLLLEPINTSLSLPAAAFRGLTNATIEFWYKTEKTGLQAILSGSQPANFEEIHVWLVNPTRVQFGGRIWDLASPVADGQWHHYAITRNATTNQAILYVDGAAQSSQSHAATAWNISDGGLIVGEEQDSVGGGFVATEAADGVIDDLRLWNVVRTATEIADNRNAALTGAEAGLRGYWRFEEAVGTSLADATAGGFHGRLDTRLNSGTNSNSLLDGVTIDAGLDLPNGSSRARFANGLTLNGTAHVDGGASLGFAGSQTLSGSGDVYFASTSVGYLEMSAAGTLTIGPQMLVHGLAGQIGGSRYWGANMNVIHQGTVDAEALNRTITVSGRNGTVTNDGTLRASGGTLTVADLASSTGTLHAAAGRTLNVTGALPLSDTSIVSVDISGTAAANIGKIVVTGAATLDGTLTATFTNSFGPAAGNNFSILTFASRSGTFDTFSVVNVPGGIVVSPVYNATNLTLSAAASGVGEPSSGSAGSAAVADDTAEEPFWPAAFAAAVDDFFAAFGA